MRDKKLLKELQSLPLDEKIEMSKDRIREWYEHWNGQIYISFSGGKDSTVLLHLVRSLYPEAPAMFCDTGLEDPSVRAIVHSQDNVDIMRPKMTFKDVITTYGYPLVSKEVAEAIYYARRSTPAPPHIHKRERLLGTARIGEESRETRRAGNCSGCGRICETSQRVSADPPWTTGERRRQDLLGQRVGNGSNSVTPPNHRTTHVFRTSINASGFRWSTPRFA